MNRFITTITIGAAVAILCGCNGTASGPSTLAKDMLGCQHKATYGKILEMAGNNDPKAGTDLINAAMATGECVELKSGAVIFPLDNATVSGVVLEKVRQKGQALEYWTLARNVNF